MEAQATHCTWPRFEPRTSQFRRKCSTDRANDARLRNYTCFIQFIFHPNYFILLPYYYIQKFMFNKNYRWIMHLKLVFYIYILLTSGLHAYESVLNNIYTTNSMTTSNKKMYERYLIIEYFNFNYSLPLLFILYTFICFLFSEKGILS